jgi:hypothetical protein
MRAASLLDRVPAPALGRAWNLEAFVGEGETQWEMLAWASNKSAERTLNTGGWADQRNNDS